MFKWFEFELNWGKRRVLAAPDKKLLDLLQDGLNLVSTKRGCGEGICGTCTVLVDGKPLNSCF